MRVTSELTADSAARLDPSCDIEGPTCNSHYFCPEAYGLQAIEFGGRAGKQPSVMGREKP